MTAGAVRFERVWKRFHRGPAHDSLRDLIPTLFRQMGRSTTVEPQLHVGDFWAVRDVSFEVNPGQALGIIGGNGAGKSTTLKLLTKVLTPTVGVAEVRGRAGALIEVSAGFHPDLTGRENVFLQGAIMGMPQRLIRERFDDIVEFSGISAFIDTPVKRYSSGMNARLGFSIAVHLEPEVLIVDEVLSVGDAEFQGRAFDRIRSLVKSDIPVVMVSHQLDRVVELCTECILLKQGEVAFRGTPTAAVHEYLQGAQTVDPAAPPNTSGMAVVAVRGPDPARVISGQECSWRIEGEVRNAETLQRVGVELIVIDASTNQRVYCNDLATLGVAPSGPGAFAVGVTMCANLPAGLYRLDTSLWDERAQTVLGNGPPVLFEVHGGRAFRGSHQLSMHATRFDVT